MIQGITADLLKTDKFLASVAFVYTKKENVILDIIEPFSSEERKAEFIPTFSEKLLEEGANRVIIVQESVKWNPPKDMTKKKAQELKEKDLHSVYFDKQEVISLLDITKDYAIEYTLPFDRTNEGTEEESITVGKLKKAAVELEDLKPIQTSLKLVR
jgi:hypothetical protein